MGGYVLYKCTSKFVDVQQDIPKSVLDLLKSRTYFDDSDELKEYLEELQSEENITKTEYKEILDYFIVNQLFEYDLEFKYD